MFFSIMIYHRILNTVLMLSNRTLMFIHFAYSSLPLMIPNSQSIPHRLPQPLTTICLFSMSVSFIDKFVS